MSSNLQNLISSSQLDEIGKWNGFKKAYLTCRDGREWRIEKLNIFQVIVRKVFGSYSDTHLNNVIAQLNNELSFRKAITPEEKDLLNRLKTLWDKHHKESFPIEIAGSVLKSFDFPKASCEALGLLNQSQGLAVGELHNDRAVCKLLIDQMPYLQSLGVKAIFIEHLLEEEADQECKDFFSSEDALSGNLKARLLYHDVLSYGLVRIDDQMTPEAAVQLLKDYQGSKLSQEKMEEVNHCIANESQKDSYNYLNLFSAAKANGIEIIPLDTQENKVYSSNKMRCEKWNPYAEARVKNRMAQEANEAKYVVLCGLAHTAAFQGVKGLDERLGIPKICVSDSKRMNDPTERLQRDAEVHHADETTVFDCLLVFNAS
jgi:hypothetical protein